MNKINLLKSAATALTVVALAACGGSGGSGDSDDSGDGSGRLSLSITDAPIHEAHAVIVYFLGARVKPAGGPALEFNYCEDPVDPVNNPPVVQDSPCEDSNPYIVEIDLLQQTGGASALLLDGVEVPAGKINWVRLVLADEPGMIKLPTGDYPLTVPSGAQTGLKLNRGFNVPEDGEARIYIDFDVRKSIVEFRRGGGMPSYKLKPTLRMVENFGAIEGEVSATLNDTTICKGGSIYVFDGAGTTPDDIERDRDDPVTSALVKVDAGSSTGYSYRIDFLDPGDYTVAFVCAGGASTDGGITFDEPADDPDRDDALSFTVSPDTATVLDDQTVRIDF